MKKSTIYSLLGCLLYAMIITSCSSEPKEPEVTEMEVTQDSLKQTDKKVSEDIEKIKKSMKDLDDKFETKN
ncbi:hypothetical protein A5893_12650 [Pedobacter psychrophilus]|uniref:Lipoprotein n=2 Tax=Pedobacter psychrophilus TaxID=1826909 RepID=A0A179DDA8_9SPHI|nr:hypothetical protein A5893_12650 [Pedobacter psychrophilus]